MDTEEKTFNYAAVSRARGVRALGGVGVKSARVRYGMCI
jgi:hypothetical protein